MYLLSCPNCHADVAVTPAQAGDRVRCPNCQQQVAVPKLGELKQLPQAASAADQNERLAATRPFGSTIAFVVFSLIALATLLAAGYNTVRWATIPSQMTTQEYLMEIEQFYDEAEPAMMVVEFEDMEERPLELVGPTRDQAINDEKARWGRNALIAFTITFAAAAIAVFAVTRGRAPANG